jgi:hypothetical protein
MMRATLVVALLAVACEVPGCATTGHTPGVERARIDLERRQLFLDCLHEYSLGTVIGEDVDYGDRDARAKAVYACAELAGLRPEALGVLEGE